jgi:predicted DNA-binding transcriptional regulator AlpA
MQTLMDAVEAPTYDIPGIALPKRIGLAKWYTMTTLPARIGKSDPTVRRLIRARAIPAPQRLGMTLRWPVEQIEAWIDAGYPRQTQD